MDQDSSPLRPIPSEPDPVQERYPNLSQFFGGYFHQDWDIEASDDRGLVRLFLASEPKEHARRVREELDELSTEPWSEAELEEIMLRSFHCGYNPSQHELTTRQWLGRINEYLAEG